MCGIVSERGGFAHVRASSPMIDETTPSVTETELRGTACGCATTGKACANCGAPMLGAFCYACGQPEKGMIRHLASVLSDVADTVFNVDSRVFRSIVPLYFRPGFLTSEYFVGRRMRYVTPFRLFFFLCVISFFAVQANLNIDNVVHFDVGEQIASAQTSAEVQAKVASAVQALEATRSAASQSSRATEKLDRKIADIHKKADERLAYLKTRAEAEAKGETPPKDPGANDFWHVDGDVGSGRRSGQGVLVACVRQYQAQRNRRAREGQPGPCPSRPAPAGRRRFLGVAADAVRADAVVRGAAEDRLHLQAPALHGAPDGRAAQPRVHFPVAAGDRAAWPAARLGGDGCGVGAADTAVCCARRRGPGCRSICS